MAYCDALGEGRFGTGLEFMGPDEKVLEVGALAAASPS